MLGLGRREGVFCAMGVVSSWASFMDEGLLTMLPPLRLRLLRTVTLLGMLWPSAEPLRGDARGGVETGAGSFDFAL